MILGFILIILTLFGAPLFTVIAASAMLGYHREGIDLMAMAIEVIGIANMPMLSAIPLFTFAGYLLSKNKNNDFAFAIIKLDTKIEIEILNKLKKMSELLEIKQVII